MSPLDQATEGPLHAGNRSQQKSRVQQGRSGSWVDRPGPDDHVLVVGLRKQSRARPPPAAPAECAGLRKVESWVRGSTAAEATSPGPCPETGGVCVSGV